MGATPHSPTFAHWHPLANAMLNVQLKLTGDIEKAMDKLGAALGEKALRSAGFAGAQMMQTEVKTRAAYRTGELRENVIIKRAEDKSDGANRQTYLVMVGKIKGDPFYWRFQEFGTSKMPARPFIRPAFDAKIDDALEVIRVRLSENLKGVA